MDQIRAQAPVLGKLPVHADLFAKLVEATQGFTRPGRVSLMKRQVDPFFDEMDAAGVIQPYGLFLTAVARVVWGGIGKPTLADLEAAVEAHSLRFGAGSGGDDAFISFQQQP